MDETAWHWYNDVALLLMITYSNSKCLGIEHFQNVKDHYVATGLTARVHGNHKKLPHNVLSITDTKNIVRFIQAYAEDHAILLPGQIPGYKRDDIQLLPSNTTKKV